MMKKFILSTCFLVVCLLSQKLSNGQYYYNSCSLPLNISDSLELNKMAEYGHFTWSNFWRVGFIDTLEECRVESIFVNFSSISEYLLDGKYKLPFLKNLSISNSNLPSIDFIDGENLPALKRLVFSVCTFDSIDKPNFNLTSLRELIVNASNFTDANMFDFTTLPELRVLKINNHAFEGVIPDFKNMPQLEKVSFDNNEIASGSIPDFSNMPLLKELRFTNNELTPGSIPNFNHMPLLKELTLYNNQLTGVIPEFDNLPLLETLVICVSGEENDFIGPIPTLENCPLLNTNDVDFSCVRPAPENTGCPISDSDSLELVNFYQVTNGENWRVNNGWLTENMTSWWGIELKDTLGKCRVNKILIRGLPDAVELPALNLPFLEELILDYNSFTGNIPNLSNLTNLKILNLGVNNFTGPLPDLSNLTQLEEINLSQNLLTDEITDYPNQTNLKILDVSDNQLTGEIPNFDNNSELHQLNVSNNLLIGSIPDFQSLPNLNYLNVSANQLNGTIPNFTNLANLYTLNVANNQLTGGLPNFSNLPVLQSLFVQGNQLSGRVPNFNNLPILEELIVCGNNFEGTAPNFIISPLLNVEAIDFSCLQAAKVSGYAYYDANENCVYDEGDITLPNGLVSINNGANYQPVDENGYFEVALEVGTNLVTFIQTSTLWQSACEDTYSITSLTINDVSEVNFANQPNVECTELTVDIGTPFLRRCFKNTYKVQYCNQGTQPTSDAYIEIEFEPEIFPLSASIPYEEDNNLLAFQLGEIGIGECGSFTVIDSVACDAPLSSTGCVEAHIYPDAYCIVPSAFWDGANLTVNAFCLDDDSVQFIIENLGEDMDAPSIYRMYEEDLIAVEGEVLLNNGAAKVLNYPAIGSTYRVAVAQTPGHPSQDNAQAFFEFCGDGNFSIGFINSQLLPDKDEFIDIDCEEIIGSYDPNDKLVTPTGVGESHDIYKGDELTYKIRFQNTGNDTAFTVILVDTLDFERLNISTLEVLNSSHPYALSIEDAQILTFTFDNILLVDSTTNEPASHGFVTFKIDQFKENEIGDVIENKAYIYFDYNEAIVTPTVFNTVAEPHIAANFQFIPLVTGVGNQLINPLFAKVYPNPASEIFYIELPKEVIHQHPNLQLEIYNTKGQVNLKQHLNLSQNSIDIFNLNKGMHYYKVFSETQIVANGKLLIQ